MTTIPQSPAIAIPDAMVEAAAKAMYELSSAPTEWDLLPVWLREIRYRHTRAALQAALTPEFLRQIVAEQVAEYEQDAQARRIYTGIKSLPHADMEFMEKWIAERAAMRSAADQPQEGGK